MAHQTQTKFCAGCGREFESRRRGGRGPQWTRFCSKQCFAACVSYKGGPEASRRRRRYGMEPEEFDRLLAEQGNACALCLAPFGAESRIYVDHNHETKRNRSLLCPRCNQRVGVFDALSWDDVLLYWGYARFHDEGKALVAAVRARLQDTRGTVEPRL